MTDRTIPCDRCRTGALLPHEAALSRRVYARALCWECREVEEWLREAPDAEGRDELWFCEPLGDYELTLMEVARA